MQRIAVRAERADGESVVVELLLELLQRGAVLQHRQLAVRIAGIISGSKLHSVDVQGLEFFEDLVKRKLG